MSKLTTTVLMSSIISYVGNQNPSTTDSFTRWFYEQNKDIEPKMSYEDLTSCLLYELAQMAIATDLILSTFVSGNTPSKVA